MDYEPVGREFESLQPHQNFEGLMMNNHESFFLYPKKHPPTCPLQIETA